ncbi:hypothetical protein PHLGIDRAFT_114397 [Phlebiopsis gigantea 11061_1 CR5-6]|uniref:Uncharacterized protein n=1 Tax=Phlebiopsis gigantea (strain 11061_1 CR5-6) TaxID=745531 RepID=A0A0C3PUX0_PHLG1|nr:hypothetical protein PHLGIDRAFT_114397 [Phlebiopsis gigantea 11061_1 CR5-6]
MPTYIFDDVFGDQRPGSKSPPVLYQPSTKEANQWDAVGGTCSQCTLDVNRALPLPLDPSMAKNGTWHTVTVDPGEPVTNLTVTFTGTALTAYCMLPPLFQHDITSYTNMTFELDGAIVGHYHKEATSNWTYNFPVFSKGELENREHTFVISPQGQDGASASYLVFDYITYE